MSHVATKTLQCHISILRNAHVAVSNIGVEGHHLIQNNESATDLKIGS